MIEISSYPVNPRLEPKLNIYTRQNSDFNRLQSNNINYSLYENFNDQVPNESNENSHDESVLDLGNRQNSLEDIQTSEYRHRLAIRRRPCVPINSKAYRRRQQQQQRYQNSGRTLYDLNFYFLGYQPTKYQVNPDTQTISQSNSQYNQYGGYDCAPNPFFQPSYINNNGASGQLSDNPSSLGSLGQGLYDFFNGLLGYGNPNAGSSTGSYDSAVGASGAVTNVAQDNVRPVFEVNVPDAIQALVGLYKKLKK